MVGNKLPTNVAQMKARDCNGCADNESDSWPTGARASERFLI
jgi:hypothetical protein